MLDLDSSRLAGRQNHAVGHVIALYPHRDALGQAHPGEDRVDLRESSRAGLRIGNVDAARDAADVAANDLAMAHELNLHRIALANGTQGGLGEIAIHPKRIRVDDADL